MLLGRYFLFMMVRCLHSIFPDMSAEVCWCAKLKWMLFETFLLWCLEQKREAPPGEKPEPVRTHLRNMIIVPEMIGSVIGVYNGKTFNQVEIKPEMISHYLAEFSISYKPVKHGRPGIGATHSSRFIPLKWRFCICRICCFNFHVMDVRFVSVTFWLSSF